RIPEGALVVESDDGDRVGVWRVPHDPVLPGLPAAMDPVRTAQLLRDLGGQGTAVSTRLRAYRPGRRAVVSVSGAGEGVFLKLVRPDKIQQLHDEHKRLPEELPVPRSLGLSRELGLMAMQSMAGLTLREALENPSLPLPPPEAVTGLVASLPQPKDRKVRASIIERVPALAEVVSAALPDVDAEVRRFVDRLGSEDVDELAPVHGDYYEAQILVDGSSVVGLLDVDTYGLGRPGDDPG